MKYKESKRQIDPLKDNEIYWNVRYQYNGAKFRTLIGAKTSSEAREKFLKIYYGDWCVIHYLEKK